MAFQASTYNEFVFDPRNFGELIAKKLYVQWYFSRNLYSFIKGSCSNLPDQANLAYGDKVTINNSRVKQYIPAEVIDFYEEILQ